MKRMLMRKPVSKMAGITLLETMFAIAVGALILIAAVIFYTSNKQSQDVSKVVTDMNSIVAQTSNYIAPGGDSITNIMKGGDSVKTLQGVGYLPDPMDDPWGNQYKATVTAGTAGVAATTQITIASLTGSGDSACKAIIQAAIPRGTNESTSTACIIQFDV